jgi:plastocyanin
VTSSSPAGDCRLAALRRRGKKPSSVLTFWALVLVIAGPIVITYRPIAAAASQPVTIKMLDMPPAFQPSMVTIKVGQSVEWENVGNEVHHATSDPSLAIKPAEVTNPHGAEPFDSGFLRPGETFTHTFTVPGEYRYTCVVHEAKGMTGKITVSK